MNQKRLTKKTRLSSHPCHGLWPPGHEAGFRCMGLLLFTGTCCPSQVSGHKPCIVNLFLGPMVLSHCCTRTIKPQSGEQQRSTLPWLTEQERTSRGQVSCPRERIESPKGTAEIAESADRAIETAMMMNFIFCLRVVGGR